MTTKSQRGNNIAWHINKNTTSQSGSIATASDGNEAGRPLDQQPVASRRRWHIHTHTAAASNSRQQLRSRQAVRPAAVASYIASPAHNTNTNTNTSRAGITASNA